MLYELTLIPDDRVDLSGFEPPTYRVRAGYSTIELQVQLCQLESFQEFQLARFLLTY